MDQKYEDERSLIFNKPEFMPVGDVLSTKVLNGSDGSHWLVFETHYSWAIKPVSARISMRGQSAEISIRLGWLEDEPCIPEGEIGVLGIDRLSDVADVSGYARVGRVETFAIPLEGRLDEFRIV